MMGSGAEAADEAVAALNARGEKVGLVKVRLYRPFSVKAFCESLLPTVRSIAVLDRTKEAGAAGEPLCLDIVNAIHEGQRRGYGSLKTTPTVIGGRYGLSSKEFTPAMVKAVYENLAQPSPKEHFTIGIQDDLNHTSLDYDPEFSTEPDSVVRALFYGLGAEDTVGANKNSIKIIGENTGNYAQEYFVYDSKKSGAMTVSHLRFGPKPIHSTHLVSKATSSPATSGSSSNATTCSAVWFREELSCSTVRLAKTRFGISCPAWSSSIAKKAKLFVIDAYEVARSTGMGSRMNTILQVCFFASSNVLPRGEAIEAIRKSIRDTYGRKGEEIVQKKMKAVDETLSHLFEVKIPDAITSTIEMPRHSRKMLRHSSAMCWR